MIAPRAAALLAAAAVAAVPAAARAVKLAGSAGLTYERSDTSTGATTFTIPAWSWHGDLALSDLPVRPELLAARAAASYAAHRSIYDEGGSAGSSWSYRGSAAVLSGAPVNLTLSAARGWDDSAAGRGLVPVGDRRASDYSGALVLAFPGYPALNATVAHSTATTHTLAAPTITSEATMLHAGGGQSLGPLRYGFTYDTSWNGGNTGHSDYRSHNLGVEADVDVSEHLRFAVADRYYLRSPTRDSPYNPRLDGHDLTTNLALRQTRNATAALTYRYGHLLARTSTMVGEIVSNALGVETSYRFSSEWNGHVGAGVSDGVSRTAASTRYDRAASLRAGGGWNRAFGLLRLHATGEANAGRVEGSRRDAPSYGAKGALEVARAVGAARLSAGYGVGYQRNDAALAGSTLSQDAHLRADGAAFGVGLSTALAGELTRRSDELLGVWSTRDVTWTSTASARALSLAFALGQQDGWSEAALPRGLLVPVSLGTRTRYASLSAGARLAGLSLGAEARVSEWTAPDRPGERETRAVLRATHVVGKLHLRFEDQYTVAATRSAERRGNVVLLSAGRRFDVL